MSVAKDAMVLQLFTLPSRRIDFWKENVLLSANFHPKSKLLINLPLLKSLKWNEVRWSQDDLQIVLVSVMLSRIVLLDFS